MIPRPPMDGTLRVAFLIVLAGAILTVQAYLRAQGAPDLTPTVRFGNDVWIVVAGGLVTVGINLEQLRRVRADQKTAVTTFKEQNGKFEALRSEFTANVTEMKLAVQRQELKAAGVDDKLKSIEQLLTFLTHRRRADRALIAEELDLQKPTP
jgi:hypothetical protein